MLFQNQKLNQFQSDYLRLRVLENLQQHPEWSLAYHVEVAKEIIEVKFFKEIVGGVKVCPIHKVILINKNTGKESRCRKCYESNFKKNLRNKKQPSLNKKKFTGFKIIQIDVKTHEFVNTFNSGAEAKKILKANKCNLVAKVKKGLSKGYIWRYEKDLTKHEIQQKRLLI